LRAAEVWRWVFAREPADPLELNLLKRALKRQSRSLRAALFAAWLALSLSPLVVLSLIAFAVAPEAMTRPLDDHPEIAYLIVFASIPILLFGYGFGAVCIAWSVRRFSIMPDDALEAFFRLGPRS
jgi:hypothetical protein